MKDPPTVKHTGDEAKSSADISSLTLFLAWLRRKRVRQGDHKPRRDGEELAEYMDSHDFYLFIFYLKHINRDTWTLLDHNKGMVCPFSYKSDML